MAEYWPLVCYRQSHSASSETVAFLTSRSSLSVILGDWSLICSIWWRTESSSSWIPVGGRRAANNALHRTQVCANSFLAFLFYLPFNRHSPCYPRLSPFSTTLGVLLSSRAWPRLVLRLGGLCWCLIFSGSCLSTQTVSSMGLNLSSSLTLRLLFFLLAGI